MIRDNPGKRALNTSEPRPEPATIDPPAVLKGEALEEWKRRAPQLLAVGVLTEVDVPAFLGYCRSWGRYVDAEAKLETTGEVVKSPTGYPIPNPYRAIANKALQQCQQFWAEFGMMPSSRSRVGGVKPRSAAPEQSKVQRFMARVK